MDFHKIEMIFEMVNMNAYSMVYKQLAKMLAPDEFRFLKKLRSKQATTKQIVKSFDEDTTDELSRDRDMVELLELCTQDIKNKNQQ